jgi:threonine dehydrogenase-like Zn-dependent dehydrogenase
MTSRTGRVAVLSGYGRKVTLERFQVPDPEPGGMILKIEQAAICGSDLHVWRGDTSREPASPADLGFGHEGFGTVLELGPGTTQDDAGRPLQVGDRVIHHVLRKLDGRGRVRGTRAYGQFPFFFSTFSDFYYVEADRPVYRVPDALPDDVLAPVNCAMGAAINGLLNGGVGFGSSVVIFGAGGLGLTAAAAAKDMGAHQVIVLDRVPARLDLAREFGADHVINVDEVATADERVALVQDLTEGRGADAALELVGLAALLPEGVAMLRPGGTFVEVGLFFKGTSVAFDPSTVLRGKRIVGSAGYPPSLIPRILDFLARNIDRRPFQKMVSHRFALDDINEALEQADWSRTQPAVTRAVLIP